MSGRRGDRLCTDDLWRLDIRPLAREGLLLPGSSFPLVWGPASAPSARLAVRCESSRVVLNSSWREGAVWREIVYEMRLATTNCRFGGVRQWWVCPGCGRRAAVLYGRGAFGCRGCLKLAYRSQRETPRDRAFRRANDMRRVFGWPPGVIQGHGPKPKNLHRATYLRLLRRYDAYVGAALDYMQQDLAASTASLAILRATNLRNR